MNFVGTLLFALLLGVAASELYSISPPLRTITNGNPVQRRQALRTKRQTFTVDQQFIDAAVNAHNNARQSVSPPATNMHIAVWNDDLATTAQNYADQCIFEHNDDATTQTQNKVWTPEYVGENLYISSYDLTAVGHITESVRLWDSEKTNYTYSTRACASVQPGCGHYTQVVWHNSANIGCGIQRCPNFFSGRGVIVVCNYGPGGNYIGQHPYSTDPSVTPCTVNPCLHGGTCSPSGSSYSCSCTSGYQGTNCATALVDPCSSDPCQNGGSCTASGSSYTCSCTSDFTGPNCDEAVDPCSPNPCLNGGSCTASGSSYTCSCTSDFTGPNCDEAVDPCSPNPCLNGGSCTASGSSYTCSCTSDFTGPNCDGVVDPCSPNPCLNGGSCTASGSSYTCSCTSDFTGPNCDEALLGTFQCGFEDDFCGFTQNVASFDWRRRRGRTPSRRTGPNSASVGSYYAYTEVSGRWTTGVSSATLESDETFTAGTWCLSFDYHMYGRDIGELQVMAGSQLVKSVKGNQGNMWDSYAKSITVSENFKLTFKGIYGGGYRGDIAIDNVKLSSGSCSPSEFPCTAFPCLNGGTCLPSGSTFTCTCTYQYTGETCDTQVTEFSTFECDFNNGNCGMIQSTSDDIDFQVDSTGSDKFLFATGNAGEEAVIHTSKSFTDVDRCVTLKVKRGWNAWLLVLAGDWGYFLRPSPYRAWIYTMRFPAGTLGGEELTIKAILHYQNAYIAFDDVKVGPCPSRNRRELKDEKQRNFFLEKTPSP